MGLGETKKPLSRESRAGVYQIVHQSAVRVALVGSHQKKNKSHGEIKVLAFPWQVVIFL